MSAIISSCGKYRYRLERDGPGEGATAIIMVNPSTADAERDDATIRKLKGFGERNGWGRLIVGNLFAYRATDVRELGSLSDPVGPENDDHLQAMIDEADSVIVAWGPLSKQPKYHRARWRKLLALSRGRTLYSIGTPAKCGHPKHPLMLGYDSPVIPWTTPGDPHD
jgi:hypothetical protein